MKVTLKRSRIGCTPAHRRVLDALGLRKTGKTVVHKNSPVIEGMIKKVKHLVEVQRER